MAARETCDNCALLAGDHEIKEMKGQEPDAEAKRLMFTRPCDNGKTEFKGTGKYRLPNQVEDMSAEKIHGLFDSGESLRLRETCVNCSQMYAHHAVNISKEDGVSTVNCGNGYSVFRGTGRYAEVLPQ